MQRQRLVPAFAIGALVAGAVRCGAPGAGGASTATPGLHPTSSAAAGSPAAGPASATGAGASARGSAASHTGPASPAGPASGAASRGAVAAEIPPAPRFTSKVYAVKSDRVLRECAASIHVNTKGPSDLAASVAAIGAACAKAARMKPLSRPVTGDQSDAQLPQSFPLRAQANHCYRVYAAAAPGLADFTLALRDSAGAAIAAHAPGGAAVLPDGGAVCFQADDAATVVFSAGMGTGAFALQIWGD